MRLIPGIEDIVLTAVVYKVNYELLAAAILGPEDRSSERCVCPRAGLDRGGEQKCLSRIELHPPTYREPFIDIC